MKRWCVAILVAIMLGGCGTTSLPVSPTDKPNEYFVIAKNFMSVFSSLEEAQKETVNQAIAYCSGLGKVYSKKYAIDRPMAVGQIPESTLYFTCTDTINTNQATTTSLSDARSKCIDLGFKAGTESFGQCILKISK